jgi:hypothetical protein
VLRVTNITEAAPLAGLSGQFVFYSGGVLTAALAASGLTAVSIVEEG